MQTPYLHKMSIVCLSLGMCLFSGCLEDMGDVKPEGLSEQGAIIGNPIINHTQQAVVKKPHQPVSPLGFLSGGTFSHADGIAGESIVGYSSTGELGLLTHAFLYTPHTGMTDVGTLSGNPEDFSAATSVNLVGSISGYSSSIIGTIRPVVFIGHVVSDLGTLGGDTGYADAINTHGVIAGQSTTSDGSFHATVWPVSGAPQDLDGEPGSFSLASALNDDGWVVGFIVSPGKKQTAFLAQVGSPLLRLPPAPGDDVSEATGINIHGLVVGTSTKYGAFFGDTQSHAVVWVGGMPIDLSQFYADQGWTLERFTAVNNRGDISGAGRLNGERHGFILHMSDN
jgi:probable HAF family extracellular repeat protein